MIEDMSVRRFSEDAQRLHSQRPGIRGLHRPLARYGDGGGSAPRHGIGVRDNMRKKVLTLVRRAPRVSWRN